jgi:ceramide glucosyltransferase
MTALAISAAIVSGLGLLTGIAGLIATIAFSFRRGAVATHFPPVSVLRPLCGNEPLLDESLASICLQNYPNFQIVFGVQDSADPVLSAIERIKARFPSIDIVVVVDGTRHGRNRKVANLINVLPAAKHDVLAISDSDLIVADDYLRCLASELELPGTGLVTAAYVGHPASDSLAGQLGTTLINHSFLPGFLLSRALGRRDCLGSTVMLRRTTLERAGGLHALSDCIAEDNLLGRRIEALGLDIRLATTLPSTIVSETSLTALWSHELRWTRTMRSVAPLALAASAAQYPLFWGGLAVALSAGSFWSVALFTAAWTLRATVALSIDEILERRFHHIDLTAPLSRLPLRDLSAVAGIVASYLCNSVVWRGQKVNVRQGDDLANAPIPSQDVGKMSFRHIREQSLRPSVEHQTIVPLARTKRQIRPTASEPVLWTRRRGSPAGNEELSDDR